VSIESGFMTDETKEQILQKANAQMKCTVDYKFKLRVKAEVSSNHI